MENWTEIDMSNLPSELRILEWKHMELGIIKGNVVSYAPNFRDGNTEYSYWIYPADGMADIWIGEFTHYRKIQKT